MRSLLESRLFQNTSSIIGLEEWLWKEEIISNWSIRLLR